MLCARARARASCTHMGPIKLKVVLSSARISSSDSFSTSFVFAHCAGAAGYVESDDVLRRRLMQFQSLRFRSSAGLRVEDAQFQAALTAELHLELCGFSFGVEFELQSDVGARACPLWVEDGHVHCTRRCPLVLKADIGE